MQAFENTSTNVAASQMRNALNKLADGVTDPAEKKVSAISEYPAHSTSKPTTKVGRRSNGSPAACYERVAGGALRHRNAR